MRSIGRLCGCFARVAGTCCRRPVFKRNAVKIRASRRAAEGIENAQLMASQSGFDPVLIGRIYEEIIGAFTDAELAQHSRK